MQRGDHYYVEVGNEETFSEYDLSVLGYENGSFGTVMEVETEAVLESYKVNGETMARDDFISYFHSWPDYEEKYDFFYNKNYITTCEEPASDNYCEYYYTCDPEVFQGMLNDVKATCNAKAEEMESL
jgi:hypothetical protein